MKSFLLFDTSRRANLPEALLYTASRLRQSCGDVRIRVAKLARPEALFDELESFGITASSEATVLLWQQDWVAAEGGMIGLACARALREKYPSVAVVTGGSLPTMAPELYVAAGVFDCVLRGYPWASDEWTKVEKSRDAVVLTISHPPVLPAELSLEEGMQFVADPAGLFAKDVFGHRFSSYFSSYHCNNACTFCVNRCIKQFGGSIVKPLDRIQQEIAYLRDTHGVTHLKSKDHNIFNDPEIGRDMLRVFSKAEGIGLTENMDVMVRDMTPENLDLLREAGVRYVFFGLETIDPEGQRLINKPFSLDQLEAALGNGRDMGLMFMGNMLLGVVNGKDDPLTVAGVRERERQMMDLWRRHQNLSVELRLYMPLLGTSRGDEIWSETAGRGDLDLETYLRMILVFILSQGWPGDLPLPSCYESPDVFDFAAKLSRAMRWINNSRSMAHHFRGRRPLSCALLDARTRFLHTLYRLGAYRLVDVEGMAVDGLKRLIMRLRS